LNPSVSLFWAVSGDMCDDDIYDRVSTGVYKKFERSAALYM
jgi:hypothetical protein